MKPSELDMMTCTKMKKNLMVMEKQIENYGTTTTAMTQIEVAETKKSNSDKLKTKNVND